MSGGDHDGVGRHIILTGTSPVVAAAVVGVVRVVVVVVVVVVAGVRLGGGDARDPNATEAGRQLRDAAAGAAEETAAAAAAALGAGQSAAGWGGGWGGGGARLSTRTVRSEWTFFFFHCSRFPIGSGMFVMRRVDQWLSPQNKTNEEKTQIGFSPL